MFSEGLASGLIGAILGSMVGGVLSILASSLAQKNLIRLYMQLDAERLIGKDRFERDRVRRQFEGHLMSLRYIRRQEDQSWAYDVLKSLRDLMKENAWLCDPKPNQEFFYTILVRLPSDGGSQPRWSESCLVSIADAARSLIVPDKGTRQVF